MSGGHWTPGLVELAGGDPLLSHPGANSQVITWEAIERADPDVIIVGPCGFDLENARKAVRELESNAIWRDLRAYHDREIYILDGNAYLNRPGPRLIDTAEIIATIVYEDTIDVPIVDPHAWEILQ
jgi:iron complex transport system substrate-binding protein